MTTEAVNPLEINRLVNKLKICSAECFKDGDLIGSLDYIESAIKIDPFNHVLWYNKAQLENKMDNLHSCLWSLNKCIEILPSYELAQEGIKDIEAKLARRLTHRIYQ